MTSCEADCLCSTFVGSDCFVKKRCACNCLNCYFGLEKILLQRCLEFQKTTVTSESPCYSSLLPAEITNNPLLLQPTLVIKAVPVALSHTAPGSRNWHQSEYSVTLLLTESESVVTTVTASDLNYHPLRDGAHVDPGE